MVQKFIISHGVFVAPGRKTPQIHKGKQELIPFKCLVNADKIQIRLKTPKK